MFQKRPCAFRKMAYICIPQRCVGRVVRRRSAKPVTVVRFRYAPHKNASTDSCRGICFPKSSHIGALHVTWRRRLPLAARLTFLGLRHRRAVRAVADKQITILPVRISGQAKPLINSIPRCYPPPPLTWSRRAHHHTTSREQAWILPLPGMSRFRCFCYYLNPPYVLHGPLRHLPPPGVSRFRQISYYLSNLVCAPVRGTSGEAGDGGQRGPVAAAHQGKARPVGPWMEYRRP